MCFTSARLACILQEGSGRSLAISLHLILQWQWANFAHSGCGSAVLIVSLELLLKNLSCVPVLYLKQHAGSLFYSLVDTKLRSSLKLFCIECIFNWIHNYAWLRSVYCFGLCRGADLVYHSLFSRPLWTLSLKCLAQSIKWSIASPCVIWSPAFAAAPNITHRSPPPTPHPHPVSCRNIKDVPRGQRQ